MTSVEHDPDAPTTLVAPVLPPESPVRRISVSRRGRAPVEVIGQWLALDARAPPAGAVAQPAWILRFAALYEGAAWLPRLGREPDRQIARAEGLTLNDVRHTRLALGVAAFGRDDWATPKEWSRPDAP